MTTHELKTWSKYFVPIVDGMKRYEFRKNDRDFKLDDILVLRETDNEGKKYLKRHIIAIITHILPIAEIVNHPCTWVVLGIKVSQVKEFEYKGNIDSSYF